MFQKGPGICTAQWTIERTIGNIKQEMRQPSNYLVNFMKEGVRRARVNALLSALPELIDSPPELPKHSLDLGNGHIFLRKCDRTPIQPSHGTAHAIITYIDRLFDPIPRIKRWGQLHLPNGQVIRSAWRECLLPSTRLRIARMMKI
jgi:hypothetical protein